MNVDDLWVLGLRANGATGYRPDWMLISWRQYVCDLGRHEPEVEAEHRAAMGLTLPEDPKESETFAEMVERLSGDEGRTRILTGPLSAPAYGYVRGEDYWDHLTGFFSEAAYQRELAHTYVLAL